MPLWSQNSTLMGPIGYRESPHGPRNVSHSSVCILLLIVDEYGITTGSSDTAMNHKMKQMQHHHNEVETRLRCSGCCCSWRPNSRRHLVTRCLTTCFSGWVFVLDYLTVSIQLLSSLLVILLRVRRIYKRWQHNILKKARDNNNNIRLLCSINNSSLRVSKIENQNSAHVDLWLNLPLVKRHN